MHFSLNKLAEKTIWNENFTYPLIGIVVILALIHPFLFPVFEKELYRVKDDRTGLYGYTKKHGGWVIKPQYEKVSGFYNGTAKVFISGYKDDVDYSKTLDEDSEPEKFYVVKCINNKGETLFTTPLGSKQDAEAVFYNTNFCFDLKAL